MRIIKTKGATKWPSRTSSVSDPLLVSSLHCLTSNENQWCWVDVFWALNAVFHAKKKDCSADQWLQKRFKNFLGHPVPCYAVSRCTTQEFIRPSTTDGFLKTFLNINLCFLWKNLELLFYLYIFIIRKINISFSIEKNRGFWVTRNF